MRGPRCVRSVLNFDVDGYVVAKCATGEKLEALRAKYRPQFSGSSVIPDVMLYDEDIREIAESLPLASIFGEDYLILPYSWVCLERYLEFHTDVTHFETVGECKFHKHPDFKMATVVVHLQQHPTGGLDIVPGSHNHPDPYVELRRKARAINKSWIKRAIRKFTPFMNVSFSHHPGSITPKVKLGEAVIFNMKCIHASNRGDLQGEKLMLFFRVGVNNAQTREYLEYIKANNDYLRFSSRVEAVSKLNTDEVRFL